MPSSRAGWHQPTDGALLHVQDLALTDFAQVEAATAEFGGLELDGSPDGLPDPSALTDIGTNEDEASDLLLIYDSNAVQWKKVVTREFPQLSNYDILNNGTVDPIADFISVWDTDAGYNKRILLSEAVESMVQPTIKQNDQTYTSDPSLNNDSELIADPLASGETYIIEGVWSVTSNSIPDFKYDFNGGTATFTWFNCEHILIPNGTTSVVRGRTTSPGTLITAATSNWPATIYYKIGCRVNASGTLVPRHAQNLSAINTTGLNRGSFQHVYRVA